MSSPLHCLITGASGYIGGRLVPEVLGAGHSVRCMARDPGKLGDRPWSDSVEIAQADALDPAAVRRALQGVDVAYYLIHSLGLSGSFEERDRVAARVFAAAARSAGVGRIVYLGGIVSGHARDLSPHLRSRAEVGDILLASGVPTAVLQAAVIIGSGSASFEMLRYLTERLPVMVTPRWVRTRIQPIAVQDVLRYLVGCATLPPSVHRRFDVGGPDIISYAQMMHRYAEVASLWPRVIIPVPLLTPRLSSLWVGLVTPVPAALARPLVESLRNEVVCADHDIAAYVEDPPGGLVPLGRAIGLALRQIRDGTVNTRWSSATPGTPGDPLPSDPPWTGGSCYLDNRVRSVHVAPETLWRLIEGIGGEQGWYSFPAAWAVRGLLDRLAGGVGLRRGRRDPSRLLPGDALDFWRVEAIEPGSLLRLRAEMKLPGRAWLELSVRPDRAGRAGRAEYRQRAIFHPRGLIGHAYWWSLRPFHGLVFGGMLRNIVATAERISPGGPLPPDGQVTRALAGHTGQMHEHAHGTEPVFDAGFWNDRYRSARQVWSGNPNPQLVTEVTGQPPGRALDSGCGEGADAIWLARNGWTVVAADISSVAVERGAQHARDADPAASARIEWRQVDLLARPPEAGSFDLVSVQFMQLPPQPRAGLFTALAAAVRPGGRLLVVGHHPTDLATGVARPPMPELFYTADEIAGLLDDSWQVDVSEARPRPALTPEGAEVTIHDAVLVATRRTGTSPPS